MVVAVEAYEGPVESDGCGSFSLIMARRWQGRKNLWQSRSLISTIWVSTVVNSWEAWDVSSFGFMLLNARPVVKVSTDHDLITDEAPWSCMYKRNLVGWLSWSDFNAVDTIQVMGQKCFQMTLREVMVPPTELSTEGMVGFYNILLSFTINREDSLLQLDTRWSTLFCV